MDNKSELIQQSNLAFDFIQKLHHEVSFLIKEIEGRLIEEEEQFVIGKPGGYGISTRKSTGLEPRNVDHWLIRKLAVCFIRKDKTKGKSGVNKEEDEGGKTGGGQTITKITDDLKVMYLRIVLNDNPTDEPCIYYGVLKDIHVKPGGKWIKKFENLMGHLEYREDKLLKNLDHIEYEDTYVKLEGKIRKHNLFDISDSQAIAKKIIKPWVELYRKM